MDEFIILSALPAEPQKGKIILGKVTDGKKIPMPGVTVRLDSATVGTASDVNGMFRLSLPMEKGTLVFSFVGYKTKKVNFSAATRDTIRCVGSGRGDGGCLRFPETEIDDKCRFLDQGERDSGIADA